VVFEQQFVANLEKVIRNHPGFKDLLVFKENLIAGELFLLSQIIENVRFTTLQVLSGNMKVFIDEIYRLSATNMLLTYTWKTLLMMVMWKV
jgi:hypothetical protein